MKKKLKAELWDKMQYLFRDFNDRVIHFELRYQYDINEDVLKTVIDHAFCQVPILHSTFKDYRLSAYWQVNEASAEEALTAKTLPASALENSITDFFMQAIPADSKYQIKFGLFKSEGNSVLCLIANHMCMDGSDFKSFVYRFCENYCKVLNKEELIPYRNGSRAYDTIYKDMSPEDRKKATSLYKNINEKDDTKFPYTAPNPDDAYFMVKRKLPASLFDGMKAIGKKYGATINDIMLASAFYSMYDVGNFQESDPMVISNAVDLRRHLKNLDGIGYTNHTAWIQCKIDKRGKDIRETLQMAKNSVDDFKKDKFMGLYGFPLLKFAYTCFPMALAEVLIKAGYSNPLIGMSNMMIIDTEKTKLGEAKPYDGFISGAVKYKPFGFLSFTTINKEITLTMCTKGNQTDREIAGRYLSYIEKHLYDLISAC